MSRTPEHNAWLEMRRRCWDPDHDAFATHGARGISVCDRWLVFENFFADMGSRPSSAHSLDRVDNDGNYEPNNCRWATSQQQMLNTRRNLIVTAFGRTAPLGEFIDNMKEPLEYQLAWKRLRRGWQAERALTASRDSRGGNQCH